MSIAAAEPPFSHLARQANKLMDQMQKGFYVYSADTWTPNVNLYETGGSYLVCVDLAGVDKEKIDVEVVDQRLKLRGARAVPTYESAVEAEGDEAATRDAGVTRAGAATSDEPEPAGAGASGEPHPVRAAGDAGEAESHPRRVRIHLMEIDHGPFSREVELPPDANRNRISATYRNGMLWVEIPKSE